PARPVRPPRRGREQDGVDCAWRNYNGGVSFRNTREIGPPRLPWKRPGRVAWRSRLATLLDKVWDLHTVRTLPTGQTQLFIGLHLIHEVTTPQAFAMLRDRDLRPAFPGRIFGTMDHIIPTASLTRPAPDPVAEAMMATLEANCREHGIPLFGLGDSHQGIVHVIGPELGLTHPGMTIACGDSHTSTHGAFGALAFGIGTSQV